MNPKITVLMPAYNAEPYIGEAIESILNQTFRDFEFIIVEDGSSDGTKKIIDSYNLKDGRIRVIDNKSNSGLVYSLNQGLDAAKGRYIARMDADDISLPQRLETQIGFMDSNKEVAVSSAWMKTIGKNSESIWSSPVTHEKIVATLFCNNCIYHPVSIIRVKDLHSLNLRYDSNYPVGQDYKLWVDISKHRRVANIPEVLHLYRVHDDQRTRKNRTSIGKNNKDNLRRRYEQPGIREDLLMNFLDRKITLAEIELHAKLFFEVPFTGRTELKKLQNWIAYLKRVNDERQAYIEPDFSNLLQEVFVRTKAKSFKYSTSDHKTFHPKILWNLFVSEERYYSAFSAKELAYLTFNSLTFRENRWFTEGNIEKP